MRHVLALAVKFVLTFVVLLIMLNLVNNYPLGPTFVLALLVTGLSYLAGDLGILPMTNNIVASVADFGLATLTIWLIGSFIMDAPIPFMVAVFAGLLIGVGEYFFHKFFVRTALPRKEAR